MQKTLPAQLRILLLIALSFHQVLGKSVDYDSTVQMNGLPDAPEITNFTCDSSYKLGIISWNEENGKNVSYYTVEYSTTNSPGEWFVYSKNVLKCPFIVVMQPGVVFKLRVIAIYKDGSSSQPSEPTEKCASKPEIPYANPNNVHVKSTSPSELEVSWNTMPKLTHNGPGFFYRVHWWKESPNFMYQVTITDWQEDRYVIKDLTPGKYTIEVKAGNKLGVSKARSHTIDGYPGLYAPILSYLKCRERQADIFWVHRGIIENIDSYSIEYDTTYAPNVWTAIVDKTDANFHIVPLNPGATYSFRVVAKFKDAKPEQPSAQTQFCTTKPDVPYMNPSNVYVKGVASNELIIFWKAMQLEQHNGPGFFYRVYWRKEGEDWNWETITNWKQDKYALSYSPSVEKYEIKVVAGNDVGESTVKPIVIEV